MAQKAQLMSTKCHDLSGSWSRNLGMVAKVEMAATEETEEMEVMEVTEVSALHQDQKCSRSLPTQYKGML